MSDPDHLVNPEAFRGAEGEPRGLSPELLDAPERETENDLRPKSLDEFVGQRRVVDNLRIALRAAGARDEVPDHVLLAGPPGLGKTSLARIVSQELDTRLHATSGPALERPKDLVGILTQLQRGDVLFIDEVHRVPAAVEEFLYAAMEDFTVDFTLDQGPHARILPIGLERFTLVGATTREGLLSSPFRSRFGLVERLVPYPVPELVRVLDRSARLLGCPLDAGAARLLAERSRGTPRIANRFLRRVRDLAEVSGRSGVDADLAEQGMQRLGVDRYGLDALDRSILRCLAHAAGQPVGLKTIAAAVGEAEDTVEEVYEPHLLRCGFVQKTSRGRVLTPAGAELVGSSAPPAADALPFE